MSNERGPQSLLLLLLDYLYPSTGSGKTFNSKMSKAAKHKSTKPH